MNAQSEFEARIRRDVARTLRHIELSGLDATELDGEVTLRIAGGELVDVTLPTPATKGRAAKAAAKAKEQAYSPDTDEGSAQSEIETD
jgi:hypothetical protein